MTEVMLNVIDAKGAIHAKTPTVIADCVVAAASVDPETIDELQLGMARFLRPGGEWGVLETWATGRCLEPWDAGIGIVDLTARLIVFQANYDALLRAGSVQYHDGNVATETWLNYHVPADWLLIDDLATWQNIAAERRAERAKRPPRDTREVIYGRLPEFIAEECLAQAAAESDASDENQTYEAVKDIHARWLMTPRDDLDGQSPREVLHARRHTIDMDLQDREFQWSTQREPPPALDPQVTAYRCAGFGSHEIVLYYDLFRDLASGCWERAVALKKSGTESTDDLRAGEVRRLTEDRDRWLASPQEATGSRTAAEVLELERSRMPLAMSSGEEMIDDDCPLCQMMADDHDHDHGPSFGPMFWHLDGCNMDDDFAFSFHSTVEEWEQDRLDWEDFNRTFEEEQREKKARAATGEDASPASDILADSPWTSSYSAPGRPTLFGIGAHLAELTVDLKESAASKPLVETLNRDFGNLCEAIRDRTTSLVEPIVERFCEDLSTIPDSRPELAAKCEDLKRQLDVIIDPGEDGAPWDDVPY